jgi:TolB-like protein
MAGDRGTTKPLPQTANELSVSTVVTGNVQRKGDRLAIDVEVVDPATSRRLLSRRYERPATQVLDLQLAIQVRWTLLRSQKTARAQRP